MNPIFTKIINRETSAESIIRDRLEALDQWIRDPVHDPLDEISQFFEPRKPSNNSWEAAGDAVDVWDDDWTPTAHFVDTVLRYLFPDKQTMHDIAMAKKEAELIDRAREFAQATKEAQLQRMLERGKEKIQKLRGFVKRLNSSKILIPAWLNPDTLEQKMLKEANDKAFQIGQKKLDDKAHKIDRNLRDQEEQEASAQSPMDAVDNEENKCATGPKELKDQEREEKRDNLVIDAKAKGKTGKAEEKEQADNAEKDDEVARLSGSDCGSGGPGNTEQCEPVVCECEPKPTAVEKKINPPKLQTHTVVKGDWLIKIAREKLGDMNRWREIYTLNKDVVGNNPNLIFPGQKLVLPPPPDEGKKEPKEGDKKEETEDKAPAGGEECTCENPNPNPDPDPNPNPDDPVDPTPDPDPTPPVVDPVPPIDDPVPDPDTTSTSGTQGEGTDPVAPTTSTTGPQGEGTGPVGPAVCAESGGECKGGGPVAPPEKHTVVKGDWLTRIARDKLGDMKRWKEIWHLNRKVIGENPDLIFPGQVLVLPPKKTRAQKAPGGRGGTNRQVAKSETHTVVRGDWLSKIARDRLGNMRRWKEIYSLNVKTIGDDPNLILPGQVLVLPPRDPDEAKAAPAGEECVCPQPGTTSTAGVGGEPTGPTPPAPSGPAEVAVSAPVTTAEGAENALFKDVIIEGAGQETLDRSSDPATLSKEAVDNAGKQKEGESAGPKMTFKAYDDLIAEIREKVQSYIDASKFAAGFGAANAFEQLLEELEADKADLEEKKGIATEAFEKQVKGQQEPTQARIEEMKQQNAEQFAQEIKDSEADLVDIKEADTHYRQSVPFEMGKLDKIQTSLAAGEAVDEAEVNAAFVKFEFAPDLKVGAWTRSMVARLRKLYSDYTRYYEAIRGAGSVAANKNLAKELSKEIEKFKAEQSQGLEHFDGETPEEKKKEQEAREKAKKNNEVYKPKPPSPEKRKEQEKLERSKADMEFQFTELESLKSAVESGEDADRGEQMDSKQLRETLKSGFEKGGLPDVDKWASYFITVLNQKYADYEADNEVVKGSGSAGASKALARSLGKQLKKLNWLFDQTMKYFESAFAQAVDEGEAAAGQSAEGGQAAEGGQTNPTENPADKVKRAREGKVTLLKRKLPLQNTLDNLENLKSAIESGEAVTQSNAKVVELTDTASFERYADGVKASISKLWPKYTGMADQIRGVGSADAPKALARKLGQEKKDLQNGYERSKELFEKIFEKKQDEKKAGKSDAGDAAADKTSDEESKKDAAVAAKDKMLETEFNLLDRLEKQISENKPISEPSAADRRDIGAELKEKYGDKATVQNLEDWLKTFTGAIAREASKYRGTYEVVRGAGSAGALEDLGTMIEEEATRRQSEIGATFTFFNSALGRKKDGESEDAVKERKNRIREIRYCADDALASLNELKAAVANNEAPPAPGETAKGDRSRSADEIARPGFKIDQWYQERIMEARNYRKTSVAEYRQLLGFGSLPAMKSMARMIEKKITGYKSTFTRTTERYEATLSDEKAEKGFELLKAPFERVFEEEMSLLEKLKEVVENAKNPTRVLERASAMPTAQGAGEGGEGGDGSNGPTEVTGQWPVKIPMGVWLVDVKQKEAAFPQRFVIFGADQQGSGIHPGEVNHRVEVKSQKEWSVGIRHHKGKEADRWNRSSLKLVSQGEKNYNLYSEDSTDNDYNDLVVNIKHTPPVEHTTTVNEKGDYEVKLKTKAKYTPFDATPAKFNAYHAETAQKFAAQMGAGKYITREGTSTKLTIDNKKIAYDMLLHMHRETNRRDARMISVEAIETSAKRTVTEVIEEDIKMWDVFFDYEDTTRDRRVEDPAVVRERQRRAREEAARRAREAARRAWLRRRRGDPIVLDLNQNNKHDTTGRNTEGDGRIDGPTVLFDLDPTNTSWSDSSRDGLPLHEIRVPNGKVVWDEKRTENFRNMEFWRARPQPGEQRAKLYTVGGRWIGEWTGQRYFWGTRQDKERTEWLKRNSGDGFLVWDKNGNGLIDDNTEMMSEYDAAGKKVFVNGFEKLAFYFDKNKDGVVNGAELNGLKIWTDDNADAQTDPGELKELSVYGITEFVVGTSWSMDKLESSFSRNREVQRHLSGANQTSAVATLDDLPEEERDKDDRGSGAVKMPPGTWKIKVGGKEAAYPQRFIVSGATEGNGTHVGEEGAAVVTVKSDKEWMLNIEHYDGNTEWKGSKLKRDADGDNFILRSEDATDDDYNDLVLHIERCAGGGDDTDGGDPPKPPPPNDGVVLQKGRWQVKVDDKNAAFLQRFVISNAQKGQGTHRGDNVGKTVVVEAKSNWRLKVENNPGDSWRASQHRLETREGSYVLKTEDWTDNDFNDLILSIKKLKQPTPPPPGPNPPKDPVAAGEMARFWGDPHFVGGDGGKFDIQGEPGKTYNLLTDKGLVYHGRFDGWNWLVTVVGKTTLKLSGKGGKSIILFEPKRNVATLNGKKIKSTPMRTADGGLVKKKGTDVITQTAEGYKIVQHTRGKGKRKYIDAEVHTGKKGVAMDGVMPGGLLGHTFDADKKKRDGKRGKAAQGEGGIDGHYTDYQVSKNKGEKIPAGTYRVQVRKAAGPKRALIEGARRGGGVLAGRKARIVKSNKPWFVRIQDNVRVNKKRRKWVDLWMRKRKMGNRKRPNFAVMAAKIWSKKYNQMDLRITRIGGGGGGGGGGNDRVKNLRGKGKILPRGRWQIRVRQKKASFSQRFIVAGANRGRGAHSGNKVGKRVNVNARRKWALRIENKPGRGRWRRSKLRLHRKRGWYRMHSEDWTDNDFNDLVLDIKRRRKRKGGNKRRRRLRGKGIILPRGHWTVRVRQKKAAFSQRFIVSGAKKGRGVHNGNKVGKRVNVRAGRKWALRIENKPGRGRWRRSKLRLRRKRGWFRLRSEDWTDNDFNDLVLDIKRAGKGKGRGRGKKRRRKLRGKGKILPRGLWQIRVRQKKAAFSQRFVVSGAKKGRGVHNGNKVGKRVNVRAGRKWALRIENKPGRGRWRRSKLRLRRKRGWYRMRSEDWTDNDFNDLVLDIKRRGKGRRRGKKRRRKLRGKGIILPRGRWTVRVRQKKAAFSQRFVVSGAKKGRGVHNGNKVGKRVKVNARRKWALRIENKPGRGRWRRSKLRKVRKRGWFRLRSEDWTDNDFNDLVLDIKRRGKGGGRRRKPRKTRGVRLPRGRWQVKVVQKKAAFSQRFVVNGKKVRKGRGRHNGNRVGRAVVVDSKRSWRLRVDHRPRGRRWAPSKHKKKRAGANFMVHTEDWRDNDYNDLVLRVRRLPNKGGGGTKPPRGPDKIAANEKARFWGDPHFQGGDGGLFDVQGEPNKTYNLLTDKGLIYHGRFDGWGRGVTVVGRTRLRVHRPGKKGTSEIVFEPKRNVATINGRKIPGKAMRTADGGLVKKQGRDVITQTAEGYRIVQHGRGKGKRQYIDAEVHTGKKGVAMDGVKPEGLMGITFDADKKRRDGKKGRGAQGEGAIDGHYTDYEVGRFKPDHPKIFNWRYYLKKYPDLRRAGLKNRNQALQHWIRHGMKEGRRAVPNFCPKQYLEIYADVRKAAGRSKRNPLHFAAIHWITYGTSEGRKGFRAPVPPPPKIKSDPPVTYAPGRWAVRVEQKRAAYHQRFIVGSARSGAGIHDGNKVGKSVDVVAHRPWSLRIEHNSGQKWAPSRLKNVDMGRRGFMLHSEDWTDNDYNDLVLSVKGGAPAPTPDNGRTSTSGPRPIATPPVPPRPPLLGPVLGGGGTPPTGGDPIMATPITGGAPTTGGTTGGGGGLAPVKTTPPAPVIPPVFTPPKPPETAPPKTPIIKPPVTNEQATQLAIAVFNQKPSSLATNISQLSQMMGQAFQKQQQIFCSTLPTLPIKQTGKAVVAPTRVEAPKLSAYVRGTAGKKPKLPEFSPLPTRKGQLPTSAGPAPRVQVTGANDPGLMAQQREQVQQQIKIAQDSLHQAIQNGPSGEHIQPQRVNIDLPVKLNAPPKLPDAPEMGPLQAFINLPLPPDLQAAFDQMHGPTLTAKLDGARSQMQSAEDLASKQKQDTILKFQEEARKANEDAQKRQGAEVQRARTELSAQRQQVLAEQQQLVGQIHTEVANRQSAEQKAIQDKIAQVDAQTQKAFADANQKASKLRADAERKAGAERKKLETRPDQKKDDGGGVLGFIGDTVDAAQDLVGDVLESVQAAVGAIFDAARQAIGSVIEDARNLAKGLIDQANQFIQDRLTRFTGWIKGAVDGLLKERFPALAAKINGFADRTLNAVKTFADVVVADLKKTVDRMGGLLASTIDGVLGGFQTAISAAFQMAKAAVDLDFGKIRLLALQAALKLAGISEAEFEKYFGKGEAILEAIIDRPGEVLNNLFEAVKQGFGKFGDNFMTHFQGGVVNWLTGNLDGSGIEMPKQYDAAGIFALSIQVMGIDEDFLKKKVGKLVGAKDPAVAEQVWTTVKTALDGGWEAVYNDHLQPFLANIHTEVLAGIGGWLQARVVKAAIIKLASMFSPVGALVQVLVTAWRLFEFLSDNFSKLAALVSSIVDTAYEIAIGQLGRATAGIESALAAALPLGLDLLARLLGLGKLADAVQDTVKKLQKRVEAAFDKVIDKIRSALGIDKKTTNNDETRPGENAVNINIKPKPVLANDHERGFVRVDVEGTGHVTGLDDAEVNKTAARDILTRKTTETVGRLSMRGQAKDYENDPGTVAAETRKAADAALRRQKMTVDHVTISMFKIRETLADQAENAEDKAKEEIKKRKEAFISGLQGGAEKAGERMRGTAKELFSRTSGRPKDPTSPSDSNEEKETFREQTRGVDPTRLSVKSAVSKMGVMRLKWQANRGEKVAILYVEKTFAGPLMNTAIPAMERKITSIKVVSIKQMADGTLNVVKIMGKLAQDAATSYVQGDESSLAMVDTYLQQTSDMMAATANAIAEHQQ